MAGFGSAAGSISDRMTFRGISEMEPISNKLHNIMSCISCDPLDVEKHPGEPLNFGPPFAITLVSIPLRVFSALSLPVSVRREECPGECIFRGFLIIPDDLLYEQVDYRTRVGRKRECVYKRLPCEKEKMSRTASRAVSGKIACTA